VEIVFRNMAEMIRTELIERLRGDFLEIGREIGSAKIIQLDKELLSVNILTFLKRCATAFLHDIL